MLDWNRKKKAFTKMSGEKKCWEVRPLISECGIKLVAVLKWGVTELLLK